MSGAAPSTGPAPLQIGTLREFLAAGDAAGVERQAHTVKGASSYVGGEALCAVALLMELTAESGDLDALRW